MFSVIYIKNLSSQGRQKTLQGPEFDVSAQGVLQLVMITRLSLDNEAAASFCGNDCMAALVPASAWAGVTLVPFTFVALLRDVFWSAFHFFPTETTFCFAVRCWYGWVFSSSDRMNISEETEVFQTNLWWWFSLLMCSWFLPSLLRTRRESCNSTLSSRHPSDWSTGRKARKKEMD